MSRDVCQVCGKDHDECECVCPTCGQPCYDDVTMADHGECYDCHKARLAGELDGEVPLLEDSRFEA